jgi:hypothetical protein
VFNAYTEKNLGKFIQENIAESVFDIHSDSGGLQIITRNLPMNDEIKNKVYDTQSRLSDAAMCFDNIPLINVGTKENKIVVFDRENLKHKARETGKNITKQIEHFLREKTKARPLIIIHGNCLETANIWSETLFNEIPKSMHEVIKGVAIGSGGVGYGTLEEVKKLFWYTQLPFDIKEKHLHLLGVGAINRMLPLLTFLSEGMIKDTFVSYDNTTHTSMNIFGRYCYGLNGKKHEIKYDRFFTNDYVEMYSDIVRILPEVSTYAKDAKEFQKVFNERTKENGLGLAMLTVAHSLSCINNFMEHVDAALKDKKELHKLMENPTSNSKLGIKYIDEIEKNVYSEIKNIKTPEDFKYWESHLGRFLKSDPTRTSHSSLDEFFA